MGGRRHVVLKGWNGTRGGGRSRGNRRSSIRWCRLGAVGRPGTIAREPTINTSFSNDKHEIHFLL